MAFRDDSELQLSQVSRGAQKLTRMIESLSKAPNIDGPSKYITKDILRSALDLQDSLVMLQRLQEASKMMSENRRKPKLDLRDGREEKEMGFGIEAMGSRRFEISGRFDERQEPRLSFDGSSRDCVEELKKVIRGSLHKQNFLSNSVDDDKRCLSQSVKFSQSCRLDERGYERMKAVCSVVAAEKPMKANPPNLIALSNAYDDEKRRLNRSVKFSQSCRLDDRGYERMKAVCSAVAAGKPMKAKSPNLIAKLMGLEEVPSGAVQANKNEQKLKKSCNLVKPNFDIEMQTATKLPSVRQNPDQKQKSLQEIIETMQFNGLLKSGRVEDPRFRSSFSDILQSKQSGRNIVDDEVSSIVIMKPLHMPCWERGEFQKGLLDKISVKEETHSVKLAQEKKVSDHELILPKTLAREEVKEMEKTKVELLQKVNTPSIEFHKQRKKDATGTCKKITASRKPPLYGKKQEEKKDAKAARALISQAKTAFAQQTKIDERLSVIKTDVPKKRSTPTDFNPKYFVKSVSQNSIGSTEAKKTSRAKSVRKSTSIKAVNNNKKLEDGKISEPFCAADDVSATTTLPVDDLPKQAEQDCNKDGISKDQKIFCEVMPKSSQCGTKSELAEVSVQLTAKKTTVRKLSGIEDSIMWLLLSNQSFLSLAREFLGLDAHQLVYYQRKGQDELVTKNAKLFLDCGKELLARKSHQRVLLNNPLLHSHMWNQNVCTSLDQLVEEISNGIEELVSYLVVDGDVTSEYMNIRLDRDLRCKETLTNVMWDIGWMSRIWVEESDQVIAEVEEHLLSFLIEDMVSDLVY